MGETPAGEQSRNQLIAHVCARKSDIRRNTTKRN